MAITRTQYSDTGQVSGSAAVNNATVGFSTPVSGHLLLLFVLVSDNTTSITTPTGWTLRTNVQSTPHAEFYYRVADGTEGTSLNVVASGVTRWCICFAEYAGVDTGTPFADTNACRTGSSAGLGSTSGAEPTYFGSLELVFNGVADTNTDGTIDAAAHTDNPKSATQINTSGGGINACYWRSSAVNDSKKIWVRVYERILTGTDQSVTEVSEYYGSSADIGAGIAAIINPASSGRVACTAQASGSGTGAWQKVNGGTWSNISTSFSTSLSGNTTVGHLLVVIAKMTQNGGSFTHTITTPANWTLMTGCPFDQLDLSTNTNNSVRWYVFYRIAASTTDSTQTFNLDSAGDPGAFSILSFSGPFNLAVGPTMEEGIDGYGLGILTHGTAPTGELSYSDTGIISCAGDSIQIAAFNSNSSGTLSNSFTNRAVSQAPFVSTRVTLTPGIASCMMQREINSTTPRSTFGAIIVGFRVNPAGSDHWGWAEGTDAMDSWQLLAAN